jgi:hypothetical protein
MKNENQPQVNEAIKQLKQALNALTGGWETDGCVPPNYVRKRGTGEVVAEVNRWCGGYQDAHEPITIGWKAQVGHSGYSGALLVSDFDTLDASIEQAKIEAHEALKKLL